MAKLLILFLTLLTWAHGHVVPERRAVTVSPFCTNVNKLVTAAKQQSAATAFCSSYISVPLVTVVKTASVQTNVAAVTKVVTVVQTTDTISATATDTITATVTTPAVVTVTKECPAAAVILAKRATVAKPNCLATYTAKAILSSACSCLSIAPSTTTKAVTATTIVTPLGTTIIVTTRVLQTRTLATATTTVASTSTVTVTPDCNPNLVRDPSFEQITPPTLNAAILPPQAAVRSTNWAVADGTFASNSNSNGYGTTPFGNNFAILVTRETGFPNLFQELTGLAPNVPYTLTFQLRYDSGDLRNNCNLVVTVDTDQIYTERLDGVKDWAPQTANNQFVLAGTAGFLVFQVQCSQVNVLPAARVAIDLVEVRRTVFD